MLAGVLALAVLLAVVVLAADNVRIRQERNQKDLALRQRASALETARRSEQQAREELFQALRSQAQARRFSRQPGQRLESLAAVAEAARIRTEDSLRDEAIAAMVLPDVGHGPSWSGRGPDTRAVAFDGLYRRYARLSERGDISVRNVPEDRELRHLETFEASLRLEHEVLYPGQVAFSPDQKLMALELAPGVIHLKEAATGRTVARLEDPFGDRSTWMAFTPDGRRLVVTARYAKTAHLWNLALIRTQLKAMGLDWDWPEFPAATPPGPIREGRLVQVVR